MKHRDPKGDKAQNSGEHGRSRRDRPTGSLRFSVLQAAAAAPIAESATSEQQEYDDDKEDCEHGHLPSLSC